jgi:hypothetical protein
MAAVPRARFCHTLLFSLVVALLFPALPANGQQLAASPARIDFGNVRIGTSIQTVTLTNSGTNGTSITISAASASGTGFSVRRVSLPLTLNAGQSVSFNVEFAPNAVGIVNGILSITSNALVPSLNIPLSGTVMQGSLFPKHATIAFANLQVGTSGDRSEVLTNYGGTNVTISEASASGTGFSLSGLSLPQTLDPGQSLGFTVAFHPTSTGLTSGHIAIKSDGLNRILIISLSGAGEQINSLPECSLGKTNNKCKLIIDRANPVAPPTIQMYSNQALTLIVKKPRAYERYFLDYQSGQAALSPDVASSVLQGLLPSLKLSEFSHSFLGVLTLPSPADSCAASDITRTPSARHVEDAVPAFQECVAQLETRAIDIYRALEPYVSPDSRAPNSTAGDADLDGIQYTISDFLKSEVAVSSRISAIATDATLKISVPDLPAIQQLTNLQKLVDGVANDLIGYNQRIADLRDSNNGAQDCANIIAITPKEASDRVQCVSITSNPDDDHVYHNMVTRMITYSLNTLNLISNSQQATPDPTKKKLLASIVVNFADSPSKPSALRWEASAGAFFSSLPVRSFSVAPVFTNGAITDNIIKQNILHPTVVPFAAANYRLSNDLGWTHWKSAIYWTGAVGVNPNTVSADFASGLSISWRSLMFSPLWHYGHDVRLTQGLYAGESLGASFKGSLATQTYWTSSFALGISIRVPSLTGR